MPSPTYTTLLKKVSEYVEPVKAKEVLDRYITGGGASPDTFSSEDLIRLMTAVTTATKLYVSDKGRRDEMVARIKLMPT